MGSMLADVATQGIYVLLGILQGQEPSFVHALRSRAAIERLDEGIHRKLPWLAEVERHLAGKGPLV